MQIEILLAFIALLLSIVSIFLSYHYWSKTFRPIVTVMVKTHSSNSSLTAFNLEVLNSGSLPAVKIQLKVEESNLEQAFGESTNDKDKERWLSCFNDDNIISILHNNEKISCSFGTCGEKNQGFWKYKAKIPITITYEGWFGKKYTQKQEIQILNSDSFTGYMWG